jgi:hypothetical protein
MKRDRGQMAGIGTLLLLITCCTIPPDTALAAQDGAAQGSARVDVGGGGGEPSVAQDSTAQIACHEVEVSSTDATEEYRQGSMSGARQREFLLAVGLGYEGEYPDVRIQPTSDEGYILVDSTLGYGPSDVSILLAKFDSAGMPLWAKAAAVGEGQLAAAVQQTSDGGYIVVGFVDINDTGDADVCLLKFDQAGNPVWATIAGSAGPWDFGNWVQQTRDGGYIVAGSTDGVYPQREVLLMKFDGMGNLLWAHTAGAFDSNVGYCVQETADDGFIVVGMASDRSGPLNLLLLKFDSSGSVVWARIPGGLSYPEGRAVRQTSDGGYIVAGVCIPEGGAVHDILLQKYDSSGSLVWSRTAGGPDSNEEVWSVAEVASGGYVVAGYTSLQGAYDLLLMKFGAAGGFLWARTADGEGHESGGWVAQATDGGFIVAGITEDPFLTDRRYLLWKSDRDGLVPGCSRISTWEPTITDAPTVTTSPSVRSSSLTLTVAAPVPTVESYSYEVTPFCMAETTPGPSPTGTLPPSATPEPSPTITPTAPTPSVTAPPSLSPTPSAAPTATAPEATATATPAPSPTATPTPSSCAQLGVSIEINTGYASPGDALSCTAYVCNPASPQRDVPLVAMLDLGIGEYWFYPSWAHWPPEFDYERLTLPTGVTTLAVLPEFTWPDTGADSFGPITIWGCLLNAEMAEVLGQLGSDEFSYGPPQ